MFMWFLFYVLPPSFLWFTLLVSTYILFCCSCVLSKNFHFIFHITLSFYSRCCTCNPSIASQQFNFFPFALHFTRARRPPSPHCHSVRNSRTLLRSYSQQVCQRRYMDAFRRYNAQFRKEVQQHELMQPTAIDAMRVHRTFAITTMWPPLHSKREINLTLEQLENVLSVKERWRLEEILKRETKRR
ncbi:uncharacterized protein LOC105210881 isoform X1 [Zeugodacus cucurbitae]|uniref:uncharacterized protein LOC105210881 isoform X1 n=1 Tax=Zeugodacus cucurbitae TaxID=28588 RepID=UPI0023D8FD57|nr:uncharacterized protein LOC105210881 isoform X1 [Zeugodacus cucurbitae]